jgi:stage II sporulation protein D
MGAPVPFVFRRPHLLPRLRLQLRLVPALLLPAALLPGALPLGHAAAAQERGVAAEGADPEVRVLLLESGVLPITALERPLRLEPGGLVIPAGQTVRLLLQDGQVLLDDGDRRLFLSSGAPLWLQSFGLRTVVGAGSPDPQPGDPAAPVPQTPQGDFQLLQRRYRGRLQVLVGRGTLQAVNHVALESYLPSVVGSEMPAGWPQDALQAQAVAARTYALRQRRPAAAFDLQATVSSQVYKGIDAETPSTHEAVASTRGQVLTFNGDLANAVFHSSGGGTTENSGDIWSRQLPYLVSVPDFDNSSPVSQWEQRLDPELLRQAFREIGGALRIDVLATTGSGRIRQARVTGPAGTLVLTGPELRTRLRLRSTLVRFETLAPELAALSPALGAAAGPGAHWSASPAQGWAPPPPPLPPLLLPAVEATPLQLPQPALVAIGRGFGHGVGMSQWGAYAMALQGRTYRQILSHYYRGTQLRPLPAP